VPPGQAAEVLANLATFGDWLSTLPKLRTALENPPSPSRPNRRCWQRWPPTRASRNLGAFRALVVAHRRLRLWGDIVAAFRQMNDDVLGSLAPMW